MVTIALAAAADASTHFVHPGGKAAALLLEPRNVGPSEREQATQETRSALPTDQLHLARVLPGLKLPAGGGALIYQ